jgi:hypothetical protein
MRAEKAAETLQKQNNELFIRIEANCSASNAKKYFDYIESKLKNTNQVNFSRTNELFRTNKQLGFVVHDWNKGASGLFNYRLLF